MIMRCFAFCSVVFLSRPPDWFLKRNKVAPCTSEGVAVACKVIRPPPPFPSICQVVEEDLAASRAESEALSKRLAATLHELDVRDDREKGQRSCSDAIS